MIRAASALIVLDRGAIPSSLPLTMPFLTKGGDRCSSVIRDTGAVLERIQGTEISCHIQSFRDMKRPRGQYHEVLSGDGCFGIKAVIAASFGNAQSFGNA